MELDAQENYCAVSISGGFQVPPEQSIKQCDLITADPALSKRLDKRTPRAFLTSRIKYYNIFNILKI